MPRHDGTGDDGEYDDVRGRTDADYMTITSTKQATTLSLRSDDVDDSNDDDDDEYDDTQRIK